MNDLKSPPVWQSTLRWIAVLPGAILGMFVASVLFGTLNWISPDPLPDDAWSTYIWQNGLKSAGEGAAFVWAGTLIAPSREKVVATVLAGLLLLVSGAIFFLSIVHKEWMSGWNVLATNFAAIAAAVYFVKNETE